ncbi:MAG TPA: hypothetical protein VGA37_14735 [Gemmatimonadales bacterium]
MASINNGKLVLGGLAAGLVINVVESVVNLTMLAGPWEDALAALNLPPLAGGAIGGFVALGFLLGILTVWIYAAIRPRFGPGPATAMKAGLATWIAFYVFGYFGDWLSGLVPTSLFLIVLAYSLVMMLGAAYVGGMVYKEA